MISEMRLTVRRLLVLPMIVGCIRFFNSCNSLPNGVEGCCQPIVHAFGGLLKKNVFTVFHGLEPAVERVSRHRKQSIHQSCLQAAVPLEFAALICTVR